MAHCFRGFPRSASNLYATDLLFVKENDFTFQINYAEQNFKCFYRKFKIKRSASQAV